VELLRSWALDTQQDGATEPGAGEVIRRLADAALGLVL